MNVILCPLCNIPIRSTEFKRHYHRNHPNESFEQSDESNPNRKTNYCSKCDSNFKCLSRHLMEMHSSRRIICPLKSCSFSTKRMYKLRLHWTKIHGEMPFPEIRDESDFTFATNGHNSKENMDKQVNLLWIKTYFKMNSYIAFFLQPSQPSTSTSSSVSLIDLHPKVRACIDTTFFFNIVTKHSIYIVNRRILHQMVTRTSKVIQSQVCFSSRTKLHFHPKNHRV